MNKSDIDKISELLTKTNDSREKIKQLNTEQSLCKSDHAWWGIQSELDVQSEHIIKCEDALLPLIEILCQEQFNLDINEANKIRDRANQAIIDLNKYRPNNYKRFISIIASIADLDSETPF